MTLVLIVKIKKKHCYLLTDFSRKGFGFDLFQTNNYLASLATMDRELAGGPRELTLPKYELKIISTGFGSCAFHGREENLHSRLGEGFALDWAIHKNCAKIWGVRFTSLTDFYASSFILSYGGTNVVILHLQMRLMLWYMDIYHRPGT